MSEDRRESTPLPAIPRTPQQKDSSGVEEAPLDTVNSAMTAGATTTALEPAALPPMDEELAENLAFMDPDNPLMKRVQDALYKQLTTARERLDLELSEKDEAVRRSQEKREQVGVELYTLQQQLAKVQESLNSAHGSFTVIKSHRDKSEAALKETSTTHKSEHEKLTTQQKSLDSRKTELETLNRTFKQIELFHEEMKSKLILTRRTTLKTEEDIVKQELEKKRQDYYIDQLTEQAKKLRNAIASYDERLANQKDETRAVHETLQDAGTEMEAIMFEKRQLLNQWKSSLIGMQRRQDVLQGIERAVQEQKESLLSHTNELNGFRHTLRKAAEESENLTLLHNKLESEVDFLNTQINSLQEKKEQLKESYSMYNKSVQANERELETITRERQSIVNELSNVRKHTVAVVHKIRKMESEIAEQMQVQLGIDKGASGTVKDARKLKAVIHEKEATIATAQNELSNIKVESLHVLSRNQNLQAQLEKLDAELKDKNSTIEKYELEIRRRNDDLSKKQGEMDLLNKKYEQLTAHSQDEAIGPLEATINNLTKLVHAKEKECSELQQFWLRSQNDLVAASRRFSEMTELIADLKMKLTVLSRKKIMLNAHFEREEKELKERQRNIRALQNDMIKINTLLSKQATTQAHLEEHNLGLEHEFRNRLKDAELECMRLEESVYTLRDEKERAIAGLIETERQIMQWEKKIQLAKETQAALDPNVGAQEIKEMKLEIHRMELRFASLQKVQERLIGEVERSVVRRETIAYRSRSKGKAQSQATLNKAISEIHKKLKATLNDLREADFEMDALLDQQQKLRAQQEEIQRHCDELAKKEGALHADIDIKIERKAKNFSEISFYQKKGKRYETIKADKYVYHIKDEEARRTEMERQIERLKKIEEIVGYIGKDFGDEARDAVATINSYFTAARAILSF
ncbi:Coiled-coil domain-containing protein 40 [Sorochytrium milnesiophthora]